MHTRALLLIITTASLIGCRATAVTEEPLPDVASPADLHDDSEQATMPGYEIGGSNVQWKIQAHDEFVLIDVREDAELEESGVIEGAVHIPLGTLSLETMQQHDIAKNDEIVVYCRSGNRSKQAYDVLFALGFANVKSLQGGILHWQEHNRPLVSWDGGDVPENSGQGSGFPDRSVQSTARIAFDRESDDLGMISKTEVTQTAFTVRNTGTETLIIGAISTSCACTSAKIESTRIEPGMSTILSVTFDPTVHEEPEDKFKRTVFLETNDPTMPEAEVSIWVDIDEES